MSKKADKNIKAIIKLQIGAGSANPSPPVGPALGQHGVNIMDFCKAFNEKTKDLEKGMPIPVQIFVDAKRGFTFITRTPPVSFLIKKALGIKSASGKPNQEKVGTLNKDQVLSIVAMKGEDLTAASEQAAINTVVGTARSMGVEVVSEVLG